MSGLIGFFRPGDWREEARLTGVQGEIVSRMRQGDELRAHPCGRIFLHSADFDRRVTRPVMPWTLRSLELKGLVEKERKGGGAGSYALTDTGDALARLYRARENFVR